MSRIGLDVWISLVGWAGLIASIALALTTLFSLPRGLDVAGAFSYAPHVVGALLTIGAGQGLGYLAEIAADTRRLRREVEGAVQKPKG
ncbi:MAG: hypothetical protein ING19_20700 [Azospirillum sp.]|nr:hypothetical protein [Azospirillum sp.]